MQNKDFVLDLGAAPGSWLQVTSQRVGPCGKVIGVYGVGYGTEEEIKELEEELRFKHIH